MEIAGDKVRGVIESFNITKNQQTQHPQPTSVHPATTNRCQPNNAGETRFDRSPCHQSGVQPRPFGFESL